MWRKDFCCVLREDNERGTVKVWCLFILAEPQWFLEFTWSRLIVIRANIGTYLTQTFALTIFIPQVGSLSIFEVSSSWMSRIKHRDEVTRIVRDFNNFIFRLIDYKKNGEGRRVIILLMKTTLPLQIH